MNTQPFLDLATIVNQIEDAIPERQRNQRACAILWSASKILGLDLSKATDEISQNQMRKRALAVAHEIELELPRFQKSKTESTAMDCKILSSACSVLRMLHLGGIEYIQKKRRAS